jgi:hypothetical protein
MKLHGIGKGGSFFPFPKNKKKKLCTKKSSINVVEKQHKLKGIFIQTP